MRRKRSANQIYYTSLAVILVGFAIALYYALTMPLPGLRYAHFIGQCPDDGHLIGGEPPGNYEHGCAISDKDGRSLKHGFWTYYYVNGAKEKEGYLNRGRRAGKWTWWYPNGIKMQEGEFWEDHPKGKWTYWDEKGNEKPPENNRTSEFMPGIGDIGKSLKQQFNPSEADSDEQKANTESTPEPVPTPEEE